MALKIDNFIAPMKGNAAFNLKSTIEKYKKIYFEEVSKELLVSYVFNKRLDRHMFFFKIPSGHNDVYPTTLMYDCLIEFNPPKQLKNSAKELADLNTYNIYVYSNSPSFIFTFDYVIKHKYDAFPRSLPRGYLSQIAIHKRPETRNMYEIMTIEKSTWICFFHLYYNGYLTKEIAKSIMSDKNESFYLKKMETQTQKLKEIKALNDIMKEEKLKRLANNNNKTLKSYTKTTQDNKNPLKINMKSSMAAKTLKSIFNHNSKMTNTKGLFKFNSFFDKGKKRR